MPQPDETTAPPAPPHRIAADFVRYAVALEAPELAWGYLHDRLTAEDAVRLAFLRRCDLGAPGEAFARVHARGPDDATELAAVCREILGDDPEDARRVWDHLALSRDASRASSEGGGAGDGAAGGGADGAAAVEASRRQLADGHREFLLDRAASGRGMNWQESSALLGTDRPEEVDAAFDRGEELVGVAVIGLALTHPDAAAILPRVARALDRALETSDPGLRHQGIVALAHTARLHCTVDRRCLDLLRRCPRGNEADQDLWGYVARRWLPWWLWRHQLGERLRWLSLRR
ncbi:hypothetical protein DY245_37750 [Streptomyces inhibens]|uniref:Uncharacterized protein n=1 Tax=Streptomyces inhibens TaxID=2293571 RepID=A0A371PT97_STRIH|nr:hypothetical protein [Streptomyces inhibens]REK85461.1 hypothetical protein DY245_37750 [Streptomyces inhibens]